MPHRTNDNNSSGRRRFRPYPKYKDSGVEWLRKIPAHWEVVPLGRLGRFSASGIDKKTVEGEEPVSMVNYTDVYANRTKKLDDSREYMQTTCPSWKAREHSLARGDILFTPSSETETEVGFSAVVTKDLPATVYSYHLVRFRPAIRTTLTLEFSKYLGNNLVVLSQFSASCKGTTRQILTREDFKTVLVVLPPFAEQRTIAFFLDRETAKIDALIEKKERLIELLQEKRTALITQAVTRGLDPTVPMKDSGIEWLGKIPMHWEALALKRIGDLKAGAGFPDEEQGMTTEEIPFFKVSDMGMPGNEREMRECQHTVSKSTARRLRAFIFPSNTIVFAKVGAALLLNRRRLLARPSCIDNNMMGFMPNKCNSTWAMYRLIGLDLGELANPGAVPSVNEGQMRDTPVALPLEPEQHAIAAFLDRETTKLDTLIEKVRRLIELLQGKRTALISSVVTGKTDVRNTIG